MGKIYSDFYLTPNRDVKIEITPTDFLNQRSDVVESGDKLITVFRAVDSPFAAKRLHDEFFDEFKLRLKTDKLSVRETLKQTVEAFNFSLLKPPSDFIPESGAIVLIVYISLNKELSLVQVGDVVLKTREKGRFQAITELHFQAGKPTHFIGHPKYCSTDESTQISSKPFIKTIKLN